MITVQLFGDDIGNTTHTRSPPVDLSTLFSQSLLNPRPCICFTENRVFETKRTANFVSNATVYVDSIPITFTLEEPGHRRSTTRLSLPLTFDAILNAACSVVRYTFPSEIVGFRPPTLVGSAGNLTPDNFLGPLANSPLPTVQISIQFRDPTRTQCIISLPNMTTRAFSWIGAHDCSTALAGLPREFVQDTAYKFLTPVLYGTSSLSSAGKIDPALEDSPTPRFRLSFPDHWVAVYTITGLTENGGLIPFLYFEEKKLIRLMRGEGSDLGGDLRTHIQTHLKNSQLIWPLDADISIDTDHENPPKRTLTPTSTPYTVTVKNFVPVTFVFPTQREIRALIRVASQAEEWMDSLYAFIHNYLSRECACRAEVDLVKLEGAEVYTLRPRRNLPEVPISEIPGAVYFILPTGFLTWKWPPGTATETAFEEVPRLLGDVSREDRPLTEFHPRFAAAELIADVPSSLGSPILVIPAFPCESRDFAVAVSGLDTPLRVSCPAREPVAGLQRELLAALKAGHAGLLGRATADTMIVEASGAFLSPATPLSLVPPDAEIAVQVDSRRVYHFEFVGGGPPCDLEFAMSDTIGAVLTMLARNRDRNPEASGFTLYYAGWPLPEARLLGDLAIADRATLVVECHGDCTDAWGDGTVCVPVRGREVTIAKKRTVSDLIKEVDFTGQRVQFVLLGEYPVNERARIGLLGVPEGVALDVKLVQERDLPFIEEFARQTTTIQRGQAGSTEDERARLYFAPLGRLGRIAYELLKAEEEFALRILQKADPMFRGFKEEDLVCQFIRLGHEWASLRRWIAVQRLNGM
jgi:hypothetical protein